MRISFLVEDGFVFRVLRRDERKKERESGGYLRGGLYTPMTMGAGDRKEGVGGGGGGSSERLRPDCAVRDNKGCDQKEAKDGGFQDG